eukprot:scaffold29433_cov223-Skeletonema_menzelii.AAC.1
MVRFQRGARGERRHDRRRAASLRKGLCLQFSDVVALLCTKGSASPKIRSGALCSHSSQRASTTKPQPLLANNDAHRQDFFR